MRSADANGTYTTRSDNGCVEEKMFWKWFRRPGRPQSAMSRCVDYQVTLPGIGEFSVSITIDCIGASCPRPQMLAIKALEQLHEGEVIEVISDNPSSVESLGSLMEVLESTHLATLKEQRQWRIYLCKGLMLPGKE